MEAQASPQIVLVRDVGIRDELVEVLCAEQEKEPHSSRGDKALPPAQHQLWQQRESVQKVLEGADRTLEIRGDEVLQLSRRETARDKKGENSHDDRTNIDHRFACFLRHTRYAQIVLAICLAVFGNLPGSQTAQEAAHKHDDQLVNFARKRFWQIERGKRQRCRQCHDRLRGNVLCTALRCIIGKCAKVEALHVSDQEHRSPV
mmetsp:Transcript_44959/g.92997  ORF Transcript_44959/g.92997 Transcript_44959/m.92997 type:complete len:203 (-) Transcript_44959:13-621(-)